MWIACETTRPHLTRPFSDKERIRWQAYGKRARSWYVRVRDESGRQREVKAGSDKSVAQSIKRDLESKVQGVKAGTLDPREAGCLDAERIPITQHVEEYVRGLEAKGCVEGHVDGFRKRLTWLLEETKITRLSQLRLSLVDTTLKTLRCWEVGSNGVALLRSPEVVLSLGKEGPTDHRGSSGGSGEAEDRDGEQASRAVSRTSRPAGHHDPGGKVQAWDDWRRSRWLYTLAIYTGLRRSELQSLTPESFDLEGATPVVFPSRPRHQE